LRIHLRLFGKSFCPLEVLQLNGGAGIAQL